MVAERVAERTVVPAAVIALVLTTGACGAAPRGAPADRSRPTARAASAAAAGSSDAPPGAAAPSAWPASVPPRPDATGFDLLVTHGGRTPVTPGPVEVTPISVRSHQVVDPPHDTARQWRAAVWVVQSAFPAHPGRGTTYVYGHACHHHACPFTHLDAVRVGDRVTVTTAEQVLAYRVERLGLSSRRADALPAWAADSTVGDRLVLVTCAYEQGDVSTDNLVVVAALVSATAR